MKTHCLAYALDRWRREGGYLVFRRSAHWGIPHALHLSEDMCEIRHFVPPDDLPRPWHALAGFDGVVLEADDERAEPMTAGGIIAGAALLLALSIGWAIRTKVAEWTGR